MTQTSGVERTIGATPSTVASDLGGGDGAASEGRHGGGRPFDVIAGRALVFISLTALGVVTYALVVAVAGPQVPVRGAMAVLLGAALAAVLLGARNWAQRGVDWLLYGDRSDPYRAILRIGHRVASSPDPAGLVPVLAETLAASLRLSFVEIKLHASDSAITIGRAPAQVTSLPLVHQGQPVGDVLVGRRGEALSRTDRRLIDGVLPQLAAAAETVRLNESLVAARERIVRAREEERRRLHRDLHDVLGPALASVGLGLDAARSRAGRDPSGADELMSQVRGEVRDCVGEVRRIIDGLRPPTLDERGLLGALEHQALALAERQVGARIQVHAEHLPVLPAAVEVVAYLIAQEALTNAIRHSGARRIDLTLAATDGDLVLEVDDDGAGLPEVDERRVDGVGLWSMVARAEEIGGLVTLGPGDGGGTRMAARLPLRGGTM